MGLHGQNQTGMPAADGDMEHEMALRAAYRRGAEAAAGMSSSAVSSHGVGPVAGSGGGGGGGGIGSVVSCPDLGAAHVHAADLGPIGEEPDPQLVDADADALGMGMGPAGIVGAEYSVPVAAPLPLGPLRPRGPVRRPPSRRSSSPWGSRVITRSRTRSTTRSTRMCSTRSNRASLCTRCRRPRCSTRPRPRPVGSRPIHTTMPRRIRCRRWSSRGRGRALALGGGELRPALSASPTSPVTPPRPTPRRPKGGRDWPGTVPARGSGGSERRTW